MIKYKVEGETKEQKFKRIATIRTQRILEDLRILGNCSNTNTYSYSEDEVKLIFGTIEKETRKIKGLFEKTNTNFTLERK